METLGFLAPARCALLVVDIQERLMPVIDGRAQVVQNALLLLRTAKVLGLPILATTQYVARIGALLPEVSAELGGVTAVDKMEFSCFGNEGFRAALARLPNTVDTLLLCGVETHICVYQTVLGGLLAGYRMWVASDGVSSRSRHNYRSGLARIRELGGVVANTEMIVYELLQRAGTPEFKELLPFLK